VPRQIVFTLEQPLQAARTLTIRLKHQGQSLANRSVISASRHVEHVVATDRGDLSATPAGPGNTGS
jgi:hypothetical protein